MNIDGKTLPLAPLAYRIATDPAFVEGLRRQSCYADLEEFQSLDPEEQNALQRFLIQEDITQTLQSDAGNAPTEGYWWTSDK